METAISNKPMVFIKSTGEGGNIFFILGEARRVMLEEGLRDEFTSLSRDVVECKSYAEALARIRQSVDLIDIDGEV